MEFRVGQVWKDKVRKPTSVYLITNIVHYGDMGHWDARDAYRITGILSTGDEQIQMDRSMHENSVRLMFPHLLFDSKEYEPPEEDK